MKPEPVKPAHVLKKWMSRKRITGEDMIRSKFGVTQAVFTHIYNGNRVSSSMLNKLEAEGVPKSIINKLKKQGL